MSKQATADTGRGPSAKEHVSTKSLVEVQGLHKSFGARQVLHDVSFDVKPSEVVAVMGHSGGGKSTLLRVLEGLEPDYSGEVLVPENRSVVFQEPRLFPWLRVDRNIAVGAYEDADQATVALRIDRLLEEVGLTERAASWPAELSGGEAQRISLARALVEQPELILLDEPFAALDALTRIQMHDLLRRLLEEHHPGAVMVTHDVNEALALSNRVLVLDEGRLVLDLSITPRETSQTAEQWRGDYRSKILGALHLDEERAL